MVALQNVDCFLRLLQIYVFSISVVNTHTHKKNNQLPSIKTVISTPILCVSYQATDQNINNILFSCELKFSL